MKELYKKLLAVQKEVGAIKKDSTNPFFHSKYFDINALLGVVKPILNKNGLVLVQGLHQNGLDTQVIDAESGEVMSFTAILPESGDAQKQGSTITYFRRYAIQSMLALEAEDDDGNTASQATQKPLQTTIAPAPVPKPKFQFTPKPGASTGQQSLDTVCDCGLPAVKRQVKKAGQNQGKWFYVCPKTMNDQTKCEYFKFVDAVLPKAKADVETEVGYETPPPTDEEMM